MPPTHSSQADVAAAYRTLIAHETEPKEQDFYRTRLQRLEQTTEPESDDFVTQLAVKQIEGEAAWWRSIDFDRNASRTFESMTGDSQQAVRTGVERVLAHLTAAGRLIPVGGMALTAEQVEDVEALVATANPYSAPAARLRALFPATEPAEEVKPVHPKPDVGDWGYGGGAAVYAPEVRGKTREELLSEKVEQLQAQVKHLSRVAVNAAEHGIKAPSGSLKPCGYCHSTEATLLHACTNCGAMTSDPWSHPTSAVPAKEETKAEAIEYYTAGRDSEGNIRLDRGRGELVALAKHVRGNVQFWHDLSDSAVHKRKYRAALDLIDRETSPVVPAPTETGPWQRIEDVPEGVLQIKDRHGRTWLMVGGTWRFEWHDGNWYEPHTNINAQAPFVAAEGN